MIGKRLGHFQILERIGVGGMGEIYRAHDEHLDRDVALKVLPTGSVPDRSIRKRFRKEALTLAKLKHPHIGIVHDFGSEDGIDFLVMELVPGSDLAQHLEGGARPEDEVVRLGIQISQALEEAHEQKIIHRDLKPKNVMVTPKGHAKVLDFGLAKFVRPIDEASTASATEMQGVVGTLPYMAPEQLRGQEADARVDVYALGVTLYEAATGQRPFMQTNSAELVTAILHATPKPPRQINPQLSEDLERVLLRALEKDPEQRYQTARELREDLERLTSGMPVAPPRRKPAWSRAWMGSATGLALLLLALWILNPAGLRGRLMGGSDELRIASLAVLPFANFSGESEQEYFVDGMTDQLITNLQRLGGIERVISRQSMKQYKDTDKSLVVISRELNVDAVLEGSVLRSGSQIQVSARLIDPATDHHVWADTFERQSKDVVALLNEVTRSIAQAIEVALSPIEAQRLENETEVDPQVLELYFQGNAFLDQRTGEAILRAVEKFEQAIARDSSYAPPYVGLSEAYYLRAWGEAALRPAEARELSEAFARKALQIDDTLAEAHAVLGLALYSAWKWSEAESEFQRALQLNPNSSEAHDAYGIYLLTLGRFDEAIAEFRRAQSLDPLSVEIIAKLSWPYVFARRPDAAIEQIQKVLELKPDYALAHYNLGLMQIQKKQYDEAVRSFQKALTLSPEDYAIQALMSYSYARLGDREQAERIASQLHQRRRSQNDVSAAMLAIMYTGLGDHEKAFDLLQQAYEEHDPVLTVLKVEPLLDDLRPDPRFGELLEKVGLGP